MKLANVRAAAVIPALVAGYLGFAATAQAQSLCPPALTLASQQDGVCVTDQVATRALFQTASEAGPQEAFVAIAGVPLLAGFTGGIVALTEPAGDTAGTLPGLAIPGLPANTSDLLAMRLSTTGTTASIDISFLSDSAASGDVILFNTFAAGLPFLGSVTETGTWQDVSSFFGVATGSVVLQSDLGVVPEPASLALLGTALVGFGLSRRRRQTAA